MKNPGEASSDFARKRPPRDWSRAFRLRVRKLPIVKLAVIAPVAASDSSENLVHRRVFGGNAPSDASLAATAKAPSRS